jgi:DNA integrity scanning protein DisA with diadenylate cyclase activity
MPAQADPVKARSAVSDLLLEAACHIGRQLHVAAILVYADAFETRERLGEFLDRAGELKLVFATRDAESCEACHELGAITVQVPDVRLSRVGQVKVPILLAVSRGVLQRGDCVLCLSGIAKSGLLDALVVATVGEEFELFPADGTENIPQHVNTEVFERALDLAISLGAEGREGRPAGTTFVLGDTEAVLRHSDQLILNPFQGYPAAERNILDPDLTETVKEFSTLDGAFVIRDDGVIETAGRFLRSTIPGEPLPRGLGARHQSAAAITAATSAVSITVSESTGNVTVYEQGRILFEIEKPRPVRPPAGRPGSRRGAHGEEAPEGGDEA